jgi:hypothetical protein
MFMALFTEKIAYSVVFWWSAYNKNTVTNLTCNTSKNKHDNLQTEDDTHSMSNLTV